LESVRGPSDMGSILDFSEKRKSEADHVGESNVPTHPDLNESAAINSGALNLDKILPGEDSDEDENPEKIAANKAELLEWVT